MDRTILTATTALLMLTTGLASVTADTVGPVANGDFEIGTAPDAVADLVAGSPADTCLGVGHQVFWGEESPQHVLFGDEQDPQPQEDGPERLATAYAEGDRDPVEDAERQSGVGHCVFSEKRGKDVLWLTPKGQTSGAAFWSTPKAEDSATRFGFGHDDEPFDREVRIDEAPGKSDHNLWQVQDQQKAFSLNFQTFRFNVEKGDITAPAHIEVGFSLSPGYAQHPYVGLFWEGGLNFRADDMSPDGAGVVELDPIVDSVAEGDIACPNAVGGGPYEPCDWYRENVTAAYQDGDLDRVRDLLGQVRIVQISFWGFNKVDGGVVLDDISIAGATTAAEELGEGNVNVNPLPE